MSSSTVARARHASLRRYRTNDDPVVVAARRDLKAARAAEYISKLVAEAPALTDAQKATLAVLLRPGAA